MDNKFPLKKIPGLKTGSFHREGILHFLIPNSRPRQADLELLTSEERNIYSRLGEKRKTEFFTGRAACRMLMRFAGTYPETDKPNWGRASAEEYFRPLHFEDHRGKRYYISISHDKIYSIACAYPAKIGVDIQRITDRLEKISGKFINPREKTTAHSDPALSTLLWTLKESCAKLYGFSLFEAFRRITALEIKQDRILYLRDGIPGTAVYQQTGSHIVCAAAEDLR